MIEDSLKEAFISFEGNNFFERNVESISKFEIENDPVFDIINRYQLKPNSILEIGSSAGHRLYGLREKFPNSSVNGVEPSTKAIEFGIKKFGFTPNQIIASTADNLSFFEDNSIDLVIMGFVFYVVDRTLLFKSIAEIDRVLKNKGNLIIIDFFDYKTFKTKYHHLKGPNYFSFKQAYHEAFTASKMYHLISKDTVNHNKMQYDESSQFGDLVSISMLKKHLTAAYE